MGDKSTVYPGLDTSIKLRCCHQCCRVSILSQEEKPAHPRLPQHEGLVG